MAKLVGAHAYNSADQNVLNTTWLSLALNSELYDTDTIHDTVTNNSRLTCNTAGIYLINGKFIWDTNQTNVRYIGIFLNNVTILALSQQLANNSAQLDQQVTTIYDLSIGDYIELRAYQDSGGTIAIKYYANYSPFLAMQRIG